MKKITFVVLILLFTFITKAQEKQTDSIASTSSSINNVDIPPQFPGGIKAFYSYIGPEIKKIRSNKKGKMLIKFIIEKDGSMADVFIIKGLNEEFDKKLYRIIADSPKWTPGVKNGETVRATYTLPLTLN